MDTDSSPISALSLLIKDSMRIIQPVLVQISWFPDFEQQYVRIRRNKNDCWTRVNHRPDSWAQSCRQTDCRVTSESLSMHRPPVTAQTSTFRSEHAVCSHHAAAARSCRSADSLTLQPQQKLTLGGFLHVGEFFHMFADHRQHHWSADFELSANLQTTLSVFSGLTRDSTRPALLQGPRELQLVGGPCCLSDRCYLSRCLAAGRKQTCRRLVSWLPRRLTWVAARPPAASVA